MSEMKQAEGFKLMQYATRDGSENEIIWNSRDGITPFIIGSPTGHKMNHICWRQDVYAPFFVPRMGDRIFIDLTLQKAMDYRRGYVAEYWEQDFGTGTLAELVRGWDGAEGKTEEELRELAVLQFAKNDMESFAPHTPDLVVVTEEMQQQFIQRAREAGRSGEPQDPREVYVKADLGQELPEVR